MGAGDTDLAKTELLSVQYLRGIAASLVVFYHARDQLPAAEALIRTELGLSGVDLFFVISGFVMTYTAALHRYSPAAFLARRAVRIIPLYWVVTALLAAALVLTPSLFNNSVFTLDSFIQSLLFIPHENPGAPGAIMPMLKLGWTLNYEIFFYLVFAALIALKPGIRTAALAALFIAFVSAVSTLRPDSTILRFWADSIIFEFIFGCAVGVAFLNGALRKLPRSLWLILLVLAVAALVVISAAPALDFPRFVAWGLPCAVIVTACVALEQGAAKPWRNGALHFLGDASYSIYLIHAYIVVAFRILWAELGMPMEDWSAVAAFVLLCFAAGVIGGCVTYVLIERPLTNTARALVLRRRRGQA